MVERRAVARERLPRPCSRVHVGVSRASLSSDAKLLVGTSKDNEAPPPCVFHFSRRRAVIPTINNPCAYEAPVDGAGR